MLNKLIVYALFAAVFFIACQQEGDKNQAAFNYVSTGESYLNAGKTDSALMCFSKALQLSPDLKQALYGAGYCYSEACIGKQQHCDSTVILFEKVLSIDSTYRSVLYNLGVAYTGLGKYDVALGYYNRAISAKPAEPDYYRNRAAVQLMLGDTSGAISDYRKMETMGFSEEQERREFLETVYKGK